MTHKRCLRSIETEIPLKVPENSEGILVGQACQRDGSEARPESLPTVGGSIMVSRKIQVGAVSGMKAVLNEP